jgi:glycosyltransferase involved in cell wall biosynthesis
MDSMSGLVLEAARNSGIPVRISHSHSTRNFGNILAQVYKKFIKRRIYVNATNLIACSEEAANWLFGKKAVMSLTLRNGVEAKKFAYNNLARVRKRRELGIGDGTFLLGHVGRFSVEKNHSFIIDIFYEIRKKNNKAMLMLVGEGPLKTEIEKKVKKLNIDSSVMFLGGRNDVSELLQAMDVMVFPSHHEGVPVSIIEAQASSLKCVVSKAVPKSADIGANLINFHSLKSEVINWVNEIEEPYKRDRNLEVELSESGYNIFYTSKEIQQYYLSLVDKLA